MYLSTSQRQLLNSTLDALLPFANERLGIVNTDTSGETDLDHQLRTELIARALWKNVQLIDEFVAQNPAHLTPEQLNCARELSSVLFSDFVYKGAYEGHGIVVHETGTYLVNRYDGDPLAQLPDATLSVRGALVPFEGKIVAVAPLITLGIPSEEHQDHLAAEARKRGVEEPTVRGEVLAERARCWREETKNRSEEGDGMAKPSHTVPGYHVGPLAGLSGATRLQAQREHYDRHARESGMHQLLMESRAIMADYFPMTLDECLDVLDEDSLCAVAEHYDDLPTTADIPRQKLIDMLCERILNDREDRDHALMWCADQQFDLLRRLMHANPISLSRLSPSETLGYFPMIPYVFILGEKSTFIAWIPPEVRSLLSEVDLDEVARMRQRLSEASHAAAALASMCGIISIDDAYESYRTVATEPFERTEFEEALVDLECCDARDSYALWTHEDTTYVISAELSDDSALARVIRWGYADHIVGTSFDAEMLTETMSSRDEGSEEVLDRHLDRELAHLNLLRCHLLASERDLPPHPLDPAMLTQSFADYLLERMPLPQIRDYIDHHMPDTEDDYDFPTCFARAILISILFERDSYDDVLDIIRLFGMQRCEGPQYPHALGRLITDAFNMLPRWELNGWSLAENTERLTGRRPEPASPVLREAGLA